MAVDALGDRMKMFEGLEAQRKFMPGVPIIARLDGRGFSRFTKGLNRPYDERMSRCMMETAKRLLENTGAVLAYTQSDEITLVFSTFSGGEIFFDGRISKMLSQLGALGTLYFYQSVLKSDMAEFAVREPSFDARVWTVPTLDEAANAVLWRELDATKNSISMAAHSYYSHSYLQGKSSRDKLALLEDKGIIWGNYPSFFKRGSYFVKERRVSTFTLEELASLPEKHNARKDPSVTFERIVLVQKEFPPLTKVENVMGMLFYGHEPVMKTDSKKVARK